MSEMHYRTLIFVPGHYDDKENDYHWHLSVKNLSVESLVMKS